MGMGLADRKNSNLTTILGGYAAIVGGLLSIVLAPFLVFAKYQTGWSIIPEPFWVQWLRPFPFPALSPLSPVELWILFGIFYSLALVLMFLGLMTFLQRLKNDNGEFITKAVWFLLIGKSMVILGDIIHTATWHQNGLTVPTPGTNAVANTAYAVHMMGMNFIMVGTMVLGLRTIRTRSIAPWQSLFLIMVFPSAIVISTTLLPTTPSGGLWIFSFMLVAFGFSILSSRGLR
jgi:hypothetical protein